MIRGHVPGRFASTRQTQALRAYLRAEPGGAPCRAAPENRAALCAGVWACAMLAR